MATAERAAEVSVVWLQELTASLQKQARPPEGYPDDITTFVSASAGPLQVEVAVTCEGDDADVGVFLGGGKDRDIAGVASSLALVAVRGAKRKRLWEELGLEAPATAGKGEAWGADKTATWSQLRRLVLGGFKLQAVAVVPTAAPGAVCSSSARLRVEPLLGGAFAGTPRAFCDARLKTACGAAFDVHRAVLAAASPVFASMLAGGMAEAAATEAELRDTTAEAAGLLVAHIYGEAIEVPLSAALQLYALADAYQVRSGLAQQLRMWLGALRLPLAELAALVPAAEAACEAAFTSSLAWQAAKVAAELAASADALRGWPLSVATAVVKRAELLPAFQLAWAWVAAQDSLQDDGQQQQQPQQQQQ
jgi:hypothetical protein